MEPNSSRALPSHAFSSHASSASMFMRSDTMQSTMSVRSLFPTPRLAPLVPPSSVPSTRSMMPETPPTITRTRSSGGDPAPTSPPVSNKGAALINGIAYLILLGFRGSLFVILKLAYRYFPPFFLLSFRCICAGLLGIMIVGLHMWIKPDHRKIVLEQLSKGENWIHLIVLSVFNSGMAFGFYTAAQIAIPASTSAVLTALVPGFALTIATTWKMNSIRVYNVVGFLISVVGVFLVLLRDVLSPTIQPCVNGTEIATGYVMNLLGSSLIAFTMVYVSRFVRMDALVVSTAQNLFAGILLLPVTFGLEYEDPTSTVKFKCVNNADLNTNPYPHYSFVKDLNFVGILLFLTMVIMGLFSTYLYTFLVQRLGAPLATTVQYFAPVVGTFLAILAFDEWIGVPALYKVASVFGVLVTLIGVFIGNRVPYSCSPFGCWRSVVWSRIPTDEQGEALNPVKTPLSDSRTDLLGVHDPLRESLMIRSDIDGESGVYDDLDN